mgnify:CR=1 FL=1
MDLPHGLDQSVDPGIVELPRTRLEQDDLVTPQPFGGRAQAPIVAAFCKIEREPVAAERSALAESRQRIERAHIAGAVRKTFCLERPAEQVARHTGRGGIVAQYPAIVIVPTAVTYRRHAQSGEIAEFLAEL